MVKLDANGIWCVVGTARIVEGTRPHHHAYAVTLPWYSPLKDYRGDVRIEDRPSGCLIIWTATCASRPGLGKLIPSSFRATYANSCGARARGRAYCAVSIGISVVWLAQGIRPLVCEIVAFGVPRTHAAVRLERHQARADERGPTLRLSTRPSSGKHPCCPSVFMAAEGQQAPTNHDDRIVLPTPSGWTKVRPQRGASVSPDRRVHPHIASSLERAPRQRRRR
jgi:hypothetical protein